ncbi:TPR-like protein [Ceratobasidium sp. AG-Ba]|nr:TPR-like protein [Ceratobasidium sp. AG-Ba]
MSARRAAKAPDNIALRLLQAVSDSADVFPPLQSAARDALRIIDLVKSFSLNKDEWGGLGVYTRDAVKCVVELMAQASTSGGDTDKNLDNLQHTLSEIAKEIEDERALLGFERFRRFRQDPERVGDMRVRIEQAISLFQLKVTTTTNINVKETLRAVQENAKDLSNIEIGITSVAQNATLDKLHTMQGASWDMSRACLDNTRVQLIDSILRWVDAVPERDSTSQPTGATIMLLTAVAGAGKTTVAHTVARICADRNQLASSFFFDRETEGRNTPRLLFSTIAADLSRMDRHIADRVITAIEENGSLPSAPISNQFVKLVLEPSRNVSLAKPMVIVIDALDEAWDDRLLRILRDQACDLPSTFRIFLTSRMRPELGSLCSRPNVQTLELDVDDEANISDISVFVPHKLRVLANDMGLGDDWPGEELTLKLVERAGGLFQWIATVCDYLRQFTNPTRKLIELLSSNDPASNSAEEKMDKLYATIIESFNWRDEEFIESYQILMGTAIASKTPMSISAMEELYDKRPIAPDLTLRMLSPLLTGMNRVNWSSQPVRLLHQSLRDFLVYRFVSLPEYASFRVSEKDKNKQLAVLCLSVLTRELKTDDLIPHYLLSGADEKPGVPQLDPGALSEALRYACQFWHGHLCQSDYTHELQDLLANFVESSLITWLEVTASYGRCYNISEVWRWAANSNDQHRNERIQDAKEKYASACLSLVDQLDYEDRREESLVVATQAVELYAVLAKDDPDSHNRNLAGSYAMKSWSCAQLGQRDEALVAMGLSVKLRREDATGNSAESVSLLAESLRNLGNRLSDVGHHEDSLRAQEESLKLYRPLYASEPFRYEYGFCMCLEDYATSLSDMGKKIEALTAIEEAVEIHRRLAMERPAAYTPDLAMSLNNLSSRLSDMGRQSEALTAIEEAVEIRRRLAMERPAAYTPDLAMSLNNLSVRLSDMGRQSEALAAIEEAVEIRRRLTMERPAAYTPDLAMSLNNLSNRLFDMGRQSEALAAIEEAVEIYRRLAMERPAAYTPDLASSLNNLSNSLSDMGRQSEALAAIEEAIEIYRRLAMERPAAYTPDLASSLNNLSNSLSDMGRQSKAMRAIEEAVEIRRRLAMEQPAAYTPDLARSLNNLSLRLSDIGRQSEALVVIEETVEIYWRLAMERPATYTPDLAMSLNNLSLHLSDMGRQSEALAAIEEAVEIYRRLAMERPAAYTPDLARSLNNLALRLSDMGPQSEALAAIEEAVEIRRRLAAQSPAAYNPQLAMSLCNLALRLHDLGRHRDALPVIQESIQLYRSLLPERPSYFTPYLAEVLRVHSRVLAALDRGEEAAVVNTEADRL